MTRNLASGGYRIFSALDPAGPEPAAGQFYMLAAEAGWGGDGGRPYLARAFSVADAAREEGGVRLDFLVQAVGPGTSRLAGARGGGGALDPRAARQALLASRRRSPRGGRSDPGRRRDRRRAARDLAPAAPGRRASRPGSCSASATGPTPGGLDLFDCSEIRLASEDGHTGHHGFVTDLLAVLLEGDDARSAAVYACGPPAMLEAVRGLCAERGVACELAMEAPMACGFGACFGCAIPLR